MDIDPLLAEDNFTGLRSDEIFELGYELSDVEHQLLHPGPFNRKVRSENRQRIARACREIGRKFSLKWGRDCTERFMELRVEGK